MEMVIEYEGWFQCRLATDPDAYDHPRGAAGWTFAFAGEPDFDRRIRFQYTEALRVEAPNIGVKVTAVQVDGAPQSDSPLLNATVDLLGGAVFEGRNGQIAPSAQEPIVPFHIQISTPAGLLLQKEDPIDLTNFLEIMRRQPVGGRRDDPELIRLTGINNYAEFRQQRLAKLQTLLPAAQGVAAENLQQRIGQLQQGLDRTNDIRFWILGFRLDWEYTLRGAAVVADPAGELPGMPQTEVDWSIRHWMGGWDADTLCGFTHGALRVPLVAVTDPV